MLAVVVGCAEQTACEAADTDILCGEECREGNACEWWRGVAATLNRLLREGLPENVMLGQTDDRSEAFRHLGEKRHSGRGNSKG